MICTLIIVGITMLVMIIAAQHGDHSSKPTLSTGSSGIGGSGVGGSGSSLYNNGTIITTAEGGNTKCDNVCIGVIMGAVAVFVGSFLTAVCIAIVMDKRYHHQKQHQKQQQWLDGSSQLTEIAIVETEPNSTAQPEQEPAPEPEREPELESEPEPEPEPEPERRDQAHKQDQHQQPQQSQSQSQDQQHQPQQQSQEQPESQPMSQSPESPQSPPLEPLPVPTSLQPPQPHLSARGGPPALLPFQPCDGRWQGQYHGNPFSLRNFGDHDMHVNLQFDASNHSVTGTRGRDDRGKFTLTGEYRMHTSRIACVKRYKWSTCTGAARVLYLGTLTNQRHIDGTWELPNGDKGTFQLDYVETEPDVDVLKYTKQDQQTHAHAAADPHVSTTPYHRNTNRETNTNINNRDNTNTSNITNSAPT